MTRILIAEELLARVRLRLTSERPLELSVLSRGGLSLIFRSAE